MVQDVTEGCQKKLPQKVQGTWDEANAHKDPCDTLYPQIFTEHMTTHPSRRWPPEIAQISVSERWHKPVRQAMKKALPNKSTGTDCVIAEALNIDPEGAANIICTPRSKRLFMTYTLKHCRMALLVLF